MTDQYALQYLQQLRTNWGVDQTKYYGRGYSSATFPLATYQTISSQPVTYPGAAHRVLSDHQNGAIVYPDPAPYNVTDPTTTQLPSKGQGFGHTDQPQLQLRRKNESSITKQKKGNRRSGVHKSKKGSAFFKYEAADNRQKCLPRQEVSYQCDENSAGCSNCLRKEAACVHNSSNHPIPSKSVHGIHPDNGTHRPEGLRFTIEEVDGVPIVILYSFKLIHACQQFFLTTDFKFEAAQVYVAMMAKWNRSLLNSWEEYLLCSLMLQKLHQQDWNHCEKGILVPIALALRRRIVLMKIQGNQILDVTSEGIADQEVAFEAIQPVYGPLAKPTKTFKIFASWSGHPHMAFMEGTLGEVARTFRFP